MVCCNFDDVCKLVIQITAFKLCWQFAVAVVFVVADAVFFTLDSAFAQHIKKPVLWFVDFRFRCWWKFKLIEGYIRFGHLQLLIVVYFFLSLFLFCRVIYNMSVTATLFPSLSLGPLLILRRLKETIEKWVVREHHKITAKHLSRLFRFVLCFSFFVSFYHDAIINTYTSTKSCEFVLLLPAFLNEIA